MKRSLKKHKLPQHGTGATVGGAVGTGAGLALNLVVPGLGFAAAPVTGALGSMVGGMFDENGGPNEQELQRQQETFNKIKYGPKQENPYVDVAQKNFNFPYGGIIDEHMANPNAELELEETFQTPDGTVGRVDGPSHDNGGVEVNLPEGTKVFSDRLKYKNGRTYAQVTKPITTKIAKLEKKLGENPQDVATANSVYLLKQQLDHYFDDQETNKSMKEMKRTLKMANGGMIKRADGSYSRRGLWDNIRDNKGSGKKPTKEMLEQERKIKAEMKMGGLIHYGGGGPFEDEQYITGYDPDYGKAVDTDIDLSQYFNPDFSGPMGENKFFKDQGVGMNTDRGYYGNNNQSFGTTGTTGSTVSTGTTSTTGTTITPPQAKTQSWASKNMGTIGQVGAGLTGAALRAYNLSKIKAPGKLANLDFSSSMYNPDLVDYSANINAANRSTISAMDEAQRGFGSSATAQAFKNKARLNQLETTGKIYQGQENVNKQLLNEARQRNQQIRMQEQTANQDIARQNMENAYNYEMWKQGQKNQIIQDLLGTTGDVFGGMQKFQNQKDVADILSRSRERTVNKDVTGGTDFGKAFGGMIREFKDGGIHIKPENRGKFTATKKRTGKSTEELTHSKNPLTRKRAIFAQNAKKWAKK